MRIASTVYFVPRWWPIALLAIVVSTIPLLAADKGAATAQSSTEGCAGAADADRAAIRAAIDSYVAAYNRGDAKAVAAHWSESGEWISPSGERFQGRQAIEKEMTSLFAEENGVHIEVVNPSIRIVSPDVAVEEGTVRVLHPTEPPSESTYLPSTLRSMASGSSIRSARRKCRKRRRPPRSLRSWRGSSAIGWTTVRTRTTRPR